MKVKTFNYNLGDAVYSSAIVDADINSWLALFDWISIVGIFHAESGGDHTVTIVYHGEQL